MKQDINISSTYNIPAEMEVLGAVFLDNDCMCDINLHSDDFFSQKHQLLYKAMQKLYSEGRVIDTTTIADVFKNDIQAIGGFSYLTQIIGATVRFDKSKVDIIKEKSNLRKMYSLLGNAIEEIKSSNKDFNNIFTELQNGIFSIGGEDPEELLSDEGMMKETLEVIEKNYNLGGRLMGYESGIKPLDEALNGFQRGKLYVIAGRPSMGKSALALNITHGIAKNKWVLFYSLEMGRQEIGVRRLSMSSLIDSVNVERGALKDYEWVKIMKNASVISQSKMITCDKPGANLNDILRQTKKLKLQGKLDMIVIDHIGIMDKQGMGDTLREQTTNICIRLKNMAKEFDIPVILLSQLSRAPEMRADKRPQLSDLKESAGIEENADIVLLIYRDEYYNPDTKDINIIEVNIAKQRGGRAGGIKLCWIPQYQKIAELYK